MALPALQNNPFAPYNPAHDENASQATIMHTGLTKRTVDPCCVGVKALQLQQRPVALLMAKLDAIATETASSARIIYEAATTTTMNMKVTKLVDRGGEGDMVTIHVENSRGLQPDDLLTVAPFGQQFWVRSVPTRTSVDCMRVGNFPSMPIPAGKILLHTGNSVPEGSMRRLGHSNFMAHYKSQSFIIRNGWAQTGTVNALRAKAGCSDLVMSNDREGMVMDHASDMNKILLYGQSFSAMENGLPFTMGDGIISAIRLCAPQNVINIAAPIDTKFIGRLIQSLQKVPAVGGVQDVLQVYCDYTSYEAWQALGKAEAGILINNGSDNPINLQYKRFAIGGKAVEVIYDEGMDENAATEGISEGFMYFFNPASVVIDYLPGRRALIASYEGMSAGTNADYNSADITAESILSEFHIKHVAPHANGVITGFNSDMVICPANLTIGETKPNYFSGSCDPSEGCQMGCE